MAAMVQAGNNLTHADWLELRKRAIFDYCKWDIQCEDHSVLAPFPLLLERATAQFLNETAEALSNEAFAAEAEIVERPELLDRLGLPRAIRRILQKSAGTRTITRKVR